MGVFLLTLKSKNWLDCGWGRCETNLTVVGVMSLTLRATPAKHNVCARLKARLSPQLWRPPASPHASQLTPDGIIVTKFILVKEGIVNRKLLLVLDINVVSPS